MADFAAARGRDYTAAANYSGHYPGFLDASRAGQPFGWPPLPPALHSMQGKIYDYVVYQILFEIFLNQNHSFIITRYYIILYFL